MYKIESHQMLERSLSELSKLSLKLSFHLGIARIVTVFINKCQWRGGQSARETETETDRVKKRGREKEAEK